MLESNKLQNMQFQAITPAQAGEPQVSMQAVNPELLRENIQDSYVANRLTENKDDPKASLYTALISIPTWLLISQKMDTYSKASRGEFDKTIHGKMARFADNLSNRIKGSSLGRSSFGKSTSKTLAHSKEFFKKYFIDKFRITRAIAYTPSKPELDIVKGQANGGIGFVGFDCTQSNDAFLKPLKNIEDLPAYAGTSEDIKKYKDLISKATSPEAKVELQQLAEFECLNKYSRGTRKTGILLENAINEFKKLSYEARASKLKDMKAFEWGYKDFAELETIKANMQENLPKVFEAATKANNKMYAYIGGTESTFWGRFVHKYFGRKVYASETANKLAAFLGNMNLDKHKDWAEVLKRTGYDKILPKTGFGKFFTKYANLIMEGATNRVAGGKLVAAGQAIYLADVIYKSIKAEGGMSEKAKTFAERFTELLSFFVCMPMAVQLMHKVGGLQYAGMTPEQVVKYREHLKIHNEKAMSGLFKTRKEWKDSYKALKSELNAGVKNPFTKLFKRIGRIVSVGLEQIRPWDKKDIGVIKDGKKVFRKGIAEKLKDLVRHPKFGIKQMTGYPMRIIIGMAVLLPFLNKIAVKGSHIIFGKPKHSLLDEGKEEIQPEINNETDNKQFKTELPLQLNQSSVQNVNPSSIQFEQPSNLLNKYTSQPVINNSPTNLLNKYKQQNIQSGNTKNNTDKKEKEPMRTYIPSPIGVQLTGTEDLTSADAAMKRADAAEEIALRTLKMN